MVNPRFQEPLAPEVARRLVRQIWASGHVSLSLHAKERMARHGILREEWERALRAGWVMAGEWEHGSWRYQVRTQDVTVVVAFRSLGELVVVTLWRNAL